MKAIMPKVPEHILEWRRRTGADQWDEMWEGVLHMAPSPNRDHQDFELALAMWLRMNWAQPKGCRVFTRINLAEPGGWPDNFRIPDIVLLTPARFEIDRNEYFDGAPDVVVEIRSPDDETYEKLSFYSSIGVSEIWVIDRDDKSPELYQVIGGDPQIKQASRDGWIESEATGIDFRSTRSGEFEIRLSGRDDTRALLP